jgi:L-lysine 2,3-aminomutase
LEKTFQLSVSLPRLSPDVQKQYWQHLIQIEKPRNMEEVKKAQKDAKQRLQQLKKEEDILAEIPRSTKNPIYEQAFREEAVIRLATPEVEEHTEHTLKDFAPLLEPNPRAMKRLVNAYSVQRDIVIRS